MTLRKFAPIAGVAGLGLVLVFAVAIPTVSGGDRRAQPARASAPLKSVKSFNRIRNKTRRSRALFTEAAKVLTHPRCVNCHPDGDRPLQGEDSRAHQPPVSRGADGFGVVGMRCQTCHQNANFDHGRVPGVAKWHLAPRSMAWAGKSAGEICAQLKDPKRNGNRTLDQITKHMSDDHLVGWAWSPGADRAPPPGDQKTFGALIDAWVKSGAACPKK